jgi:hypothetical protein
VQSSHHVSHHLFIGPTGRDGLAQIHDPSICVHPPVRRGSVPDLVAASPAAGTISIVDGTFHSYPAVGHKEIRAAIDAGWQVWGLSSMGAIRAAELHLYGMRGYGSVFERYVADPDFADDEVTVVHEADEPFRMLSEPLIHIRTYLAHLEAHGRLEAQQVAEVTRSFKERWYGSRTLEDLYATLSRLRPGQRAQFAEDLRDFGRWRVKDHDLHAYLELKPWLGVRADYPGRR